MRLIPSHKPKVSKWRIIASLAMLVGVLAPSTSAYASTVPGAPTGAVIYFGTPDQSNNGLNSPDVNWEFPSDGGSPLTSFNIYFSPVSGNPTATGYTEITGLSPTLVQYFGGSTAENLLVGGKYVTVTAVNANGEGPYSNEYFGEENREGNPLMVNGSGTCTLSYGGTTWNGTVGGSVTSTSGTDEGGDGCFATDTQQSGYSEADFNDSPNMTYTLSSNGGTSCTATAYIKGTATTQTAKVRLREYSSSNGTLVGYATSTAHNLVPGEWDPINISYSPAGGSPHVLDFNVIGNNFNTGDTYNVDTVSMYCTANN